MSQTANEITNYMGGKSHIPINFLTRLKLLILSWFLGEPSYYKEGNNNQCNKQNVFKHQDLFKRIVFENYCLFEDDNQKSREEKLIDTVNLALEDDFKSVLDLAIKCRTEYHMRKGVAYILAIAARHHKRVEFNKNNPMYFRNVIIECCLIPSDLTSIHNSWISLNGSKSKFPTFIKRAFEDWLKNISSYQLEKYRKDCIDMVRICHLNKKNLRCSLEKNGDNRDISTLMKEGKLSLEDEELKWETLRSKGLSWIEILKALQWRMPHMAALRNVRNFAFSDPGIENMNKYLEMLLAGVEGGKQFPFQYITAYKNFKSYSNNVNPNKPTYSKRKKSKQIVPQIKEIKSIYKDIIIHCLEECLQKSMKCFPSLDGDVISLSDNSGSAHGTFTSNYGTVKVSDINNLSALFAAYNCTGRGVVGIFGDKLHPYEVNKEKTLLEQYDEIQEIGKTIGQSTENGVWLFFKRAFEDPAKYKFDYLFCYSDMQVGHGGLYGNDPEMDEEFIITNQTYKNPNQKYIDIHGCLIKYRKEVNQKINTFMVQTAGYDNTILPELIYRGAILSGWTGNEVTYAKKYAELWDGLVMN